MNQEEERIDCGGPNCDPCPPSCDNGILDWDEELGWFEVGVDCGGPCSELGQDCCTNGVIDINPNDVTLSENWIDCHFDNLGPGDIGSNSECPICETCANGIMDVDEGETGIDCDDDPLTECPDCIDLCGDGLLNGAEGPCQDCGGSCPECSTAHCNNQQLDEFPNDPLRNETAIDCGGCACPPCLDLCNDGIQNGDEEAIDCGGDDCVNCVDAVLCGDGVQNGYETGIDCYDGDETPPLSACPPCQTLCENSIFDGEETDTDCGGPVCGPCGNDEVGFLRYEADGVYYESVFTSFSALRTEGTTLAPIDLITFGGGAAHPISFFIKDSDETPGTFNTGTYTASNQEIHPTPNTVSLTLPDGTMYGTDDPSGITIDFTTVDFIGPVVTPPTPGGMIEGTFSGQMFEIGGDGSTISISNGSFRLFFQI